MIDCLLFSALHFSGSPAKNGPLDFTTKNSFPLFLLVKRLWYTCMKYTILFFKFFIFALPQAKNKFRPTLGLFNGDQETKIDNF